MKYLKYFIQYLLAIICFGLFKILGPKISSFISGKFFEKVSYKNKWLLEFISMIPSVTVM